MNHESTDPHRLAIPPTDAERTANHRALSKMHVGNRFRLMFGMPLLPEIETDVSRVGPLAEISTNKNDV